MRVSLERLRYGRERENRETLSLVDTDCSGPELLFHPVSWAEALEKLQEWPQRPNLTGIGLVFN